jgi:ATP-dependent DNA helicase RecG
MEIKRILKETESKTLEFKAKLNDSVFKTLSAFANTDGGVLIIEISDQKDIIGVDCSNTFVEDMTNRIVNKLNIHPGIECVRIKGRSVMAISVERNSMPISYEGRFYKRVGRNGKGTDQKSLL